MRLNKYIPFIIVLVAAVLLFFHLQHTQEYLLFFREQLMVFYNDADIIFARYLGVGGLGLLLTHWLLQFFVLDYVGAAISAVLGALSALFIWFSLPQKSRSLLLLPLCLFPIVFQCDSLFDIYYAYQGYVAFFLFSLFAFIFSLCKSDNDNLRMGIASGLALLLFYVAGASAILFAVYVFLCYLFERPKQSWRMLLPIALVLMAAGYCVSNAYLAGYRFALLNTAYYEPIITPGNFFHTSWIIVLLIPIIAPIFSGVDAKLKPIFTTICAVVLLTVVSVYANFSAQHNQQKMYPMIAMDHYIVKEDWNSLLSSPYSQTSNFMMMNRVNLALSKSGRFLDDFFHYHQIAPYSILTNLEDLSLDVEITSTISQLYYQMDNIASADERAFNSYEGLRYGSPYNLQMLVRTSLIFGRYAQAEKYIKMLESTTFYKDWATSQRKFLYDDAAVEADPEYGSKRRSIPAGTREFVQARGPYADLLFTIRANHQATAPRDYAIGYLLLTNDVKHINEFVEEFYGTDVMPNTPLRLQEAVLAANEKDLEYCKAHGVEDQTIQEYQALKKNLIQARAAGLDQASALSPWRYTYWYYLLVTSPRMAQMREQMIREQNQKNQTETVGAHG